MRQLYLAAYDVVDERRRRMALQVARSFAIGGQKSVHECLLSPAERNELNTTMEILLDPETDRYLLVGLDPRATSFIMGRAVRPALSTVLYVG
jgi:CRISPR-associated protein Cas2